MAIATTLATGAGIYGACKFWHASGQPQSTCGTIGKSIAGFTIACGSLLLATYQVDQLQKGSCSANSQDLPCAALRTSTMALVSFGSSLMCGVMGITTYNAFANSGR